jgi:asparagine synthase (glutamine-hydrolysing)
MCGIAGVFTSDPNKTVELEKTVSDIVASQVSRGPDYQAVERLSGGMSQGVFGHDRLSIIDLSSAANQPLWDHAHTHCVVFNGEIYNYLELRAELRSSGHSFHTDSDTEVILEAFKEWGADAFERFNGMFAIAIWRKSDGRLWLARDRFGVKPLFFHSEESWLVFASTCRVIAERHCLPANLEYVSRGLRTWIYEDESEITPYHGIRALRAGHFAEISCASTSGKPVVRLCRYYNLEERIAALRDRLSSASPKELLSMVEERLASSVEIRLRSDVPVGISLSGGLDSSIIAALAAERLPNLRGITFGSPDARESEGPVVRQLQQYLGIEVDYVMPTREEMVDSFQACLKAQDSPFRGFSVVGQYMVFRAAKERGIKVMLGGQGGDETFMGYRKFQFFRLAELWRGKQYGAAAVFAVGLLRMVAAEARSASMYVRALQRYRYRSGLRVALQLPAAEDMQLGFRRGLSLDDRQILDVTRISLPSLLRFEDRNSMAHGVESRLPFMDYRMVELGAALPASAEIRNGYGKWILREAARTRIPESIRAARYKRGFDVNDSAWVSAGVGSYIRETLRQRRGVLDAILPGNVSIEERFADERLCGRGSELSEAISLLWLADVA